MLAAPHLSPVSLLLPPLCLSIKSCMLKSFTWSAAPCTFTFRSPWGKVFRRKLAASIKTFDSACRLWRCLGRQPAQCGAHSYLHFIWLINWNLLQSFLAWPQCSLQVSFRSALKSGNKYENDETFLPCQRKFLNRCLALIGLLCVALRAVKRS